MSRRARIVVVLAVGLSLAGCGNKHAQVTEAETEGPYLTVGALKYQVQISRQLNPSDVEDRAYLEGVPAAERRLAPNETWFAVFIRIVNETDRAQPAAEHFEIEDTQERRFEPVEFEGHNPFVYRPARIPPEGTLPQAGSAAEESPIGGSMLLFKLTFESLGNRPIELRIRSASGPPPEGVVDLDV